MPGPLPESDSWSNAVDADARLKRRSAKASRSGRPEGLRYTYLASSCRAADALTGPGANPFEGHRRDRTTAREAWDWKAAHGAADGCFCSASQGGPVTGAG